MLPRRLLWLCIALGAGLGVGQGAWAQSANWARYALISPTTTLSAGRLCYTDGVGIACDSSAPLASGLSLGDRITSGTDAVVVNGTTDTISFTIAGSPVANIGAGGLGITAINASGLIQSAGVSSSAGISGTTGNFSVNLGIGTTNTNSALELLISSAGGPEIHMAGNNATVGSTNGDLQLGAGTSAATLYLAAGTNAETNGNDRVVAVKPSGNVGIGNLTPAATLQVSGSFIVSTTGQNTTPTLWAGTNGRVGIGTSAPSTKLHIADDYGVTGNALTIANTNATNPQSYSFGFNSSYASGKQLIINGSGSGAAGIYFGTTNFIGLGTGTNANSFFTGGNVGVGTFAPMATLQVSGSLIVSSVAFGTNPALFVSATTGRVGIGTIAPATSLEVSGTVSASAILAGSLRVTTATAACSVAADIGNHRQNGNYLEVCSPYPP